MRVGIKVDDLCERLGPERCNQLESENKLMYVTFRAIHAHHHPHVGSDGLAHVLEGGVYAIDENVHLKVLHKKKLDDKALSSWIGKEENVKHKLNLDLVHQWVQEHKEAYYKEQEAKEANKAKRRKK